MIRFLINQQLVELDDTRADLTLLQFLREHRKLTGTKEGCAAGDCGVCTVVIAEPTPPFDGLHYRTVNSCITLMSAVHGKQLIAVEHLTQNNTLHPVQQALIDFHGSQCGFCTPGFIMSMFALYHQDGTPNRDDVLHALSGNLCRCTGYRPIIDAALSVCGNTPDDTFARNESSTLSALKELAATPVLGTNNLLVPDSRSALANAIAQHPDALLVAGSTDLSLMFTQQLKDVNTLISLSGVKSLNGCTTNEHSITFGATTPLSDLTQPLLGHFPQLAELITRFASLPIRNQATLGGNVANASPIGDMPPVLLALSAVLHIDNGTQTRTIPVSEFFTGYRQTALEKGEWLSAIEIPYLTASELVAAYKISKRMEDDISAVCAVFNVTLDNGKVESVSTGFGGVAATPVSCEALNSALKGKQWASSECLSIGKQILSEAFSPIDDVRASAEYRKTVLANLWHRFWLEHQNTSQSASGTSSHASSHVRNKIETRVVQHA